MSEIFNWTKRNEFKSRDIQSDSAPESIEAILFQSVEEKPKVNGNHASLSSDSEAPNGAAEVESVLNASVEDPSKSIVIEVSDAAQMQGEQKHEIKNSYKFDISAADELIKNVLDPLTLVGEQFRLLRSKLDHLQQQKQIKILMVTSAAASEGKTFTARSLAGIIAQEPGKKVLLIDADLRKAKSGRKNGALSEESRTQGLGQILGGELSFQNALLGSDNKQLFLLPSGPVPPNPSELLSSAKLIMVLKEASELFDWVILDTPPALAISDAITISPLCDAIIMVVRANSTSSKVVTDAIQKIGREKICGIVMNRVRNKRLSRYYQQYYRGGLKNEE
jgi:capsular exopolysaccharide synthesis family protein